MWSIIYKQDTEKPGVGTITANDNVVTLSRRLDTNSSEDIQNFMNEVLTKRAEYAKLSGESAAIVAKIEAVLNGI